MANEKLLIACCVAALVSGCGGGGGAQAQDAGALVPVLRADTGEVMGVLLDVAGSEADELRVLQTINNQATVIVISGAGAEGERSIQGERLYYAAADCTGQPYTILRGLVANKLTARHAARWYVADKDAVRQQFAYASQSINDDCLLSGGVAVGAPAVELSDLQSAAIDGYNGPYEATLVPASELTGL